MNLRKLLHLFDFRLFVGHRFLEHDLVGDVDRRLHPQRERDPVGGTRVDLLRVAVGSDDQFGEERRILDVVDHDVLQLRLECLNQVSHQIVGEWARDRLTLQRQSDRRRFERPDEDRKIAFAFQVSQDDDGIVGQ